MSPLPRLLLASAAAILLAGCGASAVGSDWALVRRGDLVLGVDVTGTLKSADTIQLGPPGVQEMWQFSITFLAPEGSEVVAGERVLAFDPKSLTKRLAAKRNEAARSAKELEKKLTSTTMARRDEQLRLAEAEAAVRRARMQVSTSPELVASVELRSNHLDLQLAEAELKAERRKSVAALARDAAEVGALEGTLRRAEDRVDELKADMKSMSVAAPRAGALLHLARHGRDKPKVGDSLWRGRKVVEVVALDDLHGDGEVDEMDGSRIEVGQPVKLRLDAHPDVQLKGEVESLLQSVQRRSRDDPRKVVRVRITVSPTQTVQLRPGMRFRGTIETGRLEHVLLVASDAVFLGSGGAVVWRERARGAESVAVQLGARNGTDVQLLGGVGEGDRLSRTRPTGAGAP